MKTFSSHNFHLKSRSSPSATRVTAEPTGLSASRAEPAGSWGRACPSLQGDAETRLPWTDRLWPPRSGPEGGCPSPRSSRFPREDSAQDAGHRPRRRQAAGAPPSGSRRRSRRHLSRPRCSPLKRSTGAPASGGATGAPAAPRGSCSQRRRGSRPRSRADRPSLRETSSASTLANNNIENVDFGVRQAASSLGLCCFLVADTFPPAIAPRGGRPPWHPGWVPARVQRAVAGPSPSWLLYLLRPGRLSPREARDRRAVVNRQGTQCFILGQRTRRGEH